MDSQIKTSKKRKQSSLSSPFSGILTRHKSQKFFIHHNRSGKTRKSRAFSPSSSLNSPNYSANQGLRGVNLVNNKFNGVVDDEIEHASIKDLRARRVFSKPPKSDDLGAKNETPKFDDVSIVGKLDESGVQFDGNDENPNLSAKGKCDLGFESKEDVLNDGNPNLSAKGKCDLGVEFKEEGLLNGGNPNLLEKSVDSLVDLKEGNPNSSNVENTENPNLKIEGVGAKNGGVCGVSIDMSPNLRSNELRSKNGEENVQTTPPDAVVLVRQIKGSDSRSPPKRISSKGGCGDAKKGVFNSKKSLVLSPCSKLKVYKAPNSFSYRRLLPFLMDLAKEDTTSAPKVNPTIKIETDAEEKAVVSLSRGSVVDCVKVDEKRVDIAVACEPQETHTSNKEEEKLLSNPKTNDSDPQQAVLCTPINCPIEKNQENSVIEESQVGTPVSVDVKNGGASHDGETPFDKTESLEDVSPTIESDHAATLDSPLKSPELPMEDVALNTPSQLSLDDGGKCSASLVEFKSEENAISLFHSSSKLETVVSPDEHGFGLANGILKRNPRGCRGVCNCLTCASFRLNAEKAFEFSQNQWLDAEELAMYLMKELSSIRCMLEKSVNGANDNAIVPVDQVQELCSRASTAEDIARSRLSQMNEDLHAHCRSKPLQRPRVKFSSSVEKKIPERRNLRR